MSSINKATMNENYYAVIMAGGVGSRFWPVSKTSFPKQFHDILGSGQTLIQKTYSRLNKLVPKENIFILTNSHYTTLVKEQLPEITDQQIVPEPAMRNTAPCILLSALKIQKKNPNALMVVAPSDHWIEDETAFINDLKQAYRACEEENNMLMTLGIKPSFPHTGYGYIQFEKNNSNPIKKVRTFTEKPTYEKAKSFVEDGNFLWNAGIFIWSVHAITKAFNTYLPEMFALFAKGIPALNTPEEQTYIEANYAQAENISIDYGIMEKASQVAILPATFDWNDLGSWGALYDELDKDGQDNVVVNAQTYLEDAQHNIISTDSNKVVVVKGLNDYIIVEDKKVLLIFPKGNEQGIKDIRNKVKEKFGNDLV